MKEFGEHGGGRGQRKTHRAERGNACSPSITGARVRRRPRNKGSGSWA
jgi:hypothetical protein